MAIKDGIERKRIESECSESRSSRGIESVNGAVTRTYYLNKKIKKRGIKELTRSCSSSRQW